MLSEGNGTETARTDLSAKVLRKCRESVEIKERFFAQNADQIAELCEKMGRQFEQGHKLWVMGNGGSACDAQHVAVEFIHPIIEKRRALPALDLVSQVPVLTAISNDKDYAKIFVDQLDLWGKPGDMALAISTSGQSPNLIYALQAARKKGMLAIAFAGKDGGRIRDVAEYCFTVPSFSIHRIQECHVTLLHILWDLIHVAMGEEDVV
ncbi:MAG TPA: SIS domain-containing protein [Candidatus Binatia bacterium]|nr:SIS domain-containing protein [Candidatus Binatia bacterium]HXV84033.1 SIS domain-containing protein [Candidatus Binatia bacterium]